jgi:hypothetical protein
MRLALGVVSPVTFIQWSMPSTGTTALVLNALVANLPQPILSSIYYVYNGIFTCFMLGAEWNGYASNRKGLRVSSSPRGSQRTSYMLQLPKRMAIPLMLLSAVLHWLCSQSIYLVSLDFDHSALVETYQNGTIHHTSSNSSESTEEFVTCGYSPIAIALTISLGVIMVIAPVMFGFRQFKSRCMPVAGSCSASISACCHLPFDETISVEPTSESRDTNAESEQERLLGRQGFRLPKGTHFVQSGDHGARKSYPFDNKAVCSSQRELTGLHQEPEHGAEAALLPVKWGITNTTMMSVGSCAAASAATQSQRIIAYCSFSSREVTEPQAELQYMDIRSFDDYG